MNAKVQELFTALTPLPDADQPEIAERLLEELRRKLSLNQPSSIEALDALREKAEIEIRPGRTDAWTTCLVDSHPSTRQCGDPSYFPPNLPYF